MSNKEEGRGKGRQEARKIVKEGREVIKKKTGSVVVLKRNIGRKIGRREDCKGRKALICQGRKKRRKEGRKRGMKEE